MAELLKLDDEQRNQFSQWMGNLDDMDPNNAFMALGKATGVGKYPTRAELELTPLDTLAQKFGYQTDRLKLAKELQRDQSTLLPFVEKAIAMKMAVKQQQAMAPSMGTLNAQMGVPYDSSQLKPVEDSSFIGPMPGVRTDTPFAQGMTPQELDQPIAGEETTRQEDYLKRFDERNAPYFQEAPRTVLKEDPTARPLPYQLQQANLVSEGKGVYENGKFTPLPLAKPHTELMTPEQIVQDARLQYSMGNLDADTLQTIEASVKGGLLPAPQPAANVRAGFGEVAKRTMDQQSVARGKVKYDQAVAEAQAQFAALPTAQQTPQRAAQVARLVQAKTGILPTAEDIIKASKNPNQPLVTIDNRQENATAKKIGEGLGEEYVGLQKSAVSASQQLSKLDRMEQLLQGMETGKLTPAMTQIQAIGESLGFQVDPSLPAKQALEALSNEIALTLRNPAGGAGMPGAMSDKDREFLMSMTPGLARTTEGNRLIITTAKRLAKRSQEVAKMARAYKQKHGGNFDDGFFDELQTFSDKNPLFEGLAMTLPQAPAKKPGWSIKPVN